MLAYILTELMSCMLIAKSFIGESLIVMISFQFAIEYKRLARELDSILTMSDRRCPKVSSPDESKLKSFIDRYGELLEMQNVFGNMVQRLLVCQMVIISHCTKSFSEIAVGIVSMHFIKSILCFEEKQ